ncbi:MAG: CYTH domain-containing protein [Rickettsiales bacterium]|jgi:adenylate cyclase class IV|nr:CYTH domain-containing protein [Rickettsiales bacterium]
MIEIELRFAAKTMPKALLEMAPAREKSRIDIYYDTADYALLRRGGFLRVRNGRRLDFKGDLSGGEIQHDYCNETNFDLDAIAEKSAEINGLLGRFGIPAAGGYDGFDDMIRRNGLRVLATIDKLRREYKITDDLLVAIDDAKDIGLFIEAEVMAPDDAPKNQIQEIIRQIRADLAARGILEPGSEPVNIGYVEAYLMRHNPAAYELGLYKA